MSGSDLEVWTENRDGEWFACVREPGGGAAHFAIELGNIVEGVRKRMAFARDQGLPPPGWTADVAGRRRVVTGVHHAPTPGVDVEPSAGLREGQVVEVGGGFAPMRVGRVDGDVALLLPAAEHP